jgi:hypothetical protein
MAFVVENNKTINPVHIRLFGAVGIMFKAQDIALPIQSLFERLNHARHSEKCKSVEIKSKKS